MKSDTEIPSTWQEVRDVFREWRENSFRNSEDVVELWEDILCESIHKLGSEKWMVIEQVFIASLDCNRLDIGEICLRQLNEQFPGSLRVKKLKAMKFEAIERYDDALKLYDILIKQDETNGVVRKRKIAVLKAQNRIGECVKELTEYLKTFMNDCEAWMELCDLYIAEQEFQKAGFCMEEVLTSNPHNHLYHQRYAEIRYSQGGQENLEIAKTHYAQAAKLHPGNIRALYGLLLTASNLAASSKISSVKKDELVKLAMWASSETSNRYKGSVDIKAVEGMLAGMQLAIK